IRHRVAWFRVAWCHGDRRVAMSGRVAHMLTCLAASEHATQPFISDHVPYSAVAETKYILRI
ncbi:MAG: hypothetical protein KDA52_16435, partial [Planctomycetaceae bacterium]|nr:hypothetical protein [Planctomycetaceae bacterium]